MQPFQLQTTMVKPRERCPRLVLVPCPYQGHVTPMLQLGGLLQSHGFSITVAHTHFNFPDPSNTPGFDFLSIPDGLSENEKASGDFLDINNKLNSSCIETLTQTIGRYKHRDEISCIIYDAVLYFAEEVARFFNLPCMILRTLCAGSVQIYPEYPRLRQAGYIPLQESKIEEIVPGFGPLRFKDLPIYQLNNYERLLEFLEQVSKPRSSAAIIMNTVEFLDHVGLTKMREQDKLPVYAIGPLHKIAPSFSSSLLKEDNSCITWLDKQAKNSVVYVSIGSVASISKDEFIEMVWGLADAKQPFLWVIRPGSVHGSEWIEFLPHEFLETVGERGCIVKWAPQKEVLAHESVGGFWSHCGWNSTLESISEGVPMICSPCFADQRLNARYLSHVWQVGLVLEKFERGGIESAVEKLMDGEEGRQMRQRMMDFKDEVQKSIREGGSSYNSVLEIVGLIRSFLREG